MSRRCRFVSDLHHFSRRAQRDRYESAVHQAVEETDVLVLGGDIFDFKWSTLTSQQETIREACRWLTDLASLNRHCEVQYVLGNHDFNDPFMEALDDLAEDCPNFHWHRYHLQIGKALFLHGDVADCRMDQDELVSRRQAWKKHGRPPAVYHDFYSVAIHLRLHRLPAFFIHRSRQVAERLVYYIDRNPELNRNSISQVYFGHTHVVMDGYEFEGLKFHNAGAPMKGLKFRMVDAEIL